MEDIWKLQACKNNNFIVHLRLQQSMRFSCHIAYLSQTYITCNIYGHFHLLVTESLLYKTTGSQTIVAISIALWLFQLEHGAKKYQKYVI